MNRFVAFLSALLRSLRRLLVVVFGAALVMFTLLFGTLLALALLLWAKLRGRPVVHVHAFKRRRQAGDVVDVEAHEVPPATPPLLQRPGRERQP